MAELKNSVNKSNESAAGPDGVYYQFLRHLPESCLHTLLKLFNNIWTTGDIPPSWREALVVPIPKPGEDLSDPSNYRPIELTSCLCKTLERMVNDRLVHVLESRNLLKDRLKATRLRDGASVFIAELEGIALALTEIKKLTKYHKNFVIYSDSLSALQAIQSKHFKVKDIRCLYNLTRKFPPYVHISFVWIPAHVGIQGNENVDKLAKAALSRASCLGKLICWSDLKPKTNAYIHSIWQKKLGCLGSKQAPRNTSQLGRKPPQERRRSRTVHDIFAKSPKVNVDGKYFCDFPHQLSKDRVQYLIITGDVIISSVQFDRQNIIKQDPDPPAYSDVLCEMEASKSASGPIYNRPTPVTVKIPGGFHFKKIACIRGVVKAGCIRFYVDLVCGLSSNIALRFDVRVNYGTDHNIIACSHKENATFSMEEIHETSFFPFMPGSEFEIRLLYKPECIKVFVNREHYCDFNHRINPNEEVDHIHVAGDVTLSEISWN
ncbi:galectin [Plakobranchus ocellatus]|uniref:Galectin n=1 Tax=Plakobranchus ocellatus TaxID=259542 RepID=A0AAV4DFI4_9GAST|nr:galectin [Plakobranchus ocellatus]